MTRASADIGRQGFALATRSPDMRAAAADLILELQVGRLAPRTSRFGSLSGRAAPAPVPGSRRLASAEGSLGADRPSATDLGRGASPLGFEGSHVSALAAIAGPAWHGQARDRRPGDHLGMPVLSDPSMARGPLPKLCRGSLRLERHEHGPMPDPPFQQGGSGPPAMGLLYGRRAERDCERERPTGLEGKPWG